MAVVPGPLPFVNSMPADSKACLSAVTVELCAANTPEAPSRRFMVGREMPEARARSRCSQRNSARAARISSLVEYHRFLPLMVERWPTGSATKHMPARWRRSRSYGSSRRQSSAGAGRPPRRPRSRCWRSGSTARANGHDALQSLALIFFFCLPLL